MAQKKKGKCPKCGADLSGGLNALSKSETLYKGNSEYEDYPSFRGELDYLCPECGEFLTDSEEEADGLMGCSK